MGRVTAFIVAAGLVAISNPADAQSQRDDRRDRQEAARAQGVPPGQMPPPDECRVWYDNRPNGRQPSATSCARAEAIAARDRNARVIYGQDVYWSRAGYGYDGRDHDRAVRRGRVRDPRMSGGTIDPYDRDARNPAFSNGYRDGFTKGREDVEDGDQYEPQRHSWYRSASRGYENEYGTRYEYIDRYRRGFEAGYAEGYRVYRRR